MNRAELKRSCLDKVIRDLEDLRTDLNEGQARGNSLRPDDLGAGYVLVRLDNIVRRFRICGEMDDAAWEALTGGIPIN